ncbi:MAG: hypothetical protein BJ554DRAFT_3486, partial [Olpidium bornovanus]
MWGEDGCERDSERERESVTIVRRLRQQLLEAHSFFARKTADVVTGPPALDRVEVVHARGAEGVQDEGQLVVVVPAGKQRPPAEHLREDAPDGPHVDCLGVLLERQHDLRGAVPAGGDVLGHEAGGRRVGAARAARQPQVADLEVAVGVEQQVARLQVPVQDVRRVHVLQRPQRLVHEVLAVVVGQGLRADHPVQVGLHELLYDVDLPERSVVLRLRHVQDGNDVLVVEVLEEFDLPQRPQAEHRVVKRGDLFDRDLRPGGLVNRGAEKEG